MNSICICYNTYEQIQHGVYSSRVIGYRSYSGNDIIRTSFCSANIIIITIKSQTGG